MSMFALTKGHNMHIFFYSFFNARLGRGLFNRSSAQGGNAPIRGQQRITEDGQTRITEDGQIRITE